MPAVNAVREPDDRNGQVRFDEWGAETGLQPLAAIPRRFPTLLKHRPKKPPSEIQRLRERHLRPHVDSFFAWVAEQRVAYRDQRGYARTALEYANNQRPSLTRFFDDGKLVLTNNGAERALKTIATGRKAWLFCGSDDHAKSTAALFSVVVSARLHRLDVQEYLRCLIRLVPMWPQDRMLELAPLFWSRTQARLDPRSSRPRSDGSRSPPSRSIRARQPSIQLRADVVVITLVSMRSVRPRRYTAPCTAY
jgi:hypothetical protein